MIKVKVSKEKIIEAGLGTDTPFSYLPDFIELEAEPIEETKQMEPLQSLCNCESFRQVQRHIERLEKHCNELAAVVNRLTKER